MNLLDTIDLEDDSMDAFEEREAAYDEIDVSRLLQGFGEKSKDVAKFYISKFFSGREMHYGGPIPKSVLTSQKYIKMILGMDVCRGVEAAYDLMAQSGQVACEAEEGAVADDVQVMVDILGECARLGIPKCFVSGIALMYLEVCRGLEIPKNLVQRSLLAE